MDTCEQNVHLLHISFSAIIQKPTEISHFARLTHLGHSMSVNQRIKYKKCVQIAKNVESW